MSKEKLISFVEKGALGPEDEVMSGNGYWFALKEKDLLDKYVLGDIPQSFDPISEAESVLSISQEKKEGTSSLYPNPDPLKFEKEKLAQNNQPSSSSPIQEEGLVPDEDELAYPDVEDLEYPDFGDIPDDDEPQTQVLKLDSSFSSKQAPSEENRDSLVEEIEDDMDEESEDWDGHLPAHDDLEYPDLGEAEPAPEAENRPPQQPEIDEEAVKKNSPKPPQPQRKKKVIEAPKRNDRYLFYILALVVLLTLGVFYYYRKILNKPLPLIGVLISEVQAQNLVQDPSGLKKKEFLGHFPSLKISTVQKFL